MTNLFKILCLILLTSLVTLGVQAGETHSYTVTGEIIAVEPPNSTPTEPESSDADAPPLEPADLSNSTVTISYERTNLSDETNTVTLYKGPFLEDFSNWVQLSEPTKVSITIQVTEDSNPMTIHTVFGNGSDVHFAYIDRPGPMDNFWLAGVTDQVMNSEQAFSVSGDLSFLELDPNSPTAVEVYGMYLDADGNRQTKQWGPVLVKDNSFEIKADIDQPLTASMYLQGGHYSMANLVLEANGEFVMAKLGDQIEEIGFTSDSNYHAAVVESWQQNDEYISLLETYATEYDAYLKRREAGEPEPEVAESESQAEEPEEVADVTAPADGCDDAVAEASNIPDSSWTPPSYYRFQQKATALKNEILRSIVEEHSDPMVRWLALDMRPYSYDDFDSQLAAMRAIAKDFDEEFVASQITPRIESAERAMVVQQNDATLVPGQKVPEFTLANYDGEDMSLFEILGEKDMVLIDFWASWCGPCIADFPELKNLHAAYTDEEFEIVGVSIDSTQDDWIGGVDDHELPWINLGEVKGWEGPVSTMYGVMGIPKGFLVDSQGCIYKKNIRPAALKEFLVDRYGMDESLIEPTEEIEENPEVSS